MHNSISYRDYIAPRHQTRRKETERRKRQIAAGILIPGSPDSGLTIPGVAPAPIAETPLPSPGASIPSIPTAPAIQAPAPKKPRKKSATPRGESDHVFTQGSATPEVEPSPIDIGAHLLDEAGPVVSDATEPDIGEAAIPELDRTAAPENLDNKPVADVGEAEDLIEDEPQKQLVHLGNDKTVDLPISDTAMTTAIEAKVKNVGKLVTWTAFGKENSGNIFCVVPIGMTPNDLDIGSGKSKAKPRDALSYIVAVDGGGHAWPETKALQIVKND